jgi:AcrR family transcriptional regulator
MAEPVTSRGRETKRRVVAAAAELMYVRGVSATSLDDVLAASGTGKSQFYHYFRSREELIEEVLSHQLGEVLTEQRRFAIDSWQGIRAWMEGLVVVHETKLDFRGCPLGSIAGEILEEGSRLRSRASEAFVEWESSLAAGLGKMQERDLLRRDADAAAIAEAMISTLQGGYLLAATKRDSRPMRTAVGLALDHLRSFRFDP